MRPWALSGWRRLKWLADLVGLMRTMDADGIAHLHHVAGTVGAGRAATQAVVLAARLLGTPLPPAVAEAMATDRWTRWLVSRAERLLTDPAGFDNPGERAPDTLPIHLMAMQLGPAPGYRRAVLSRYWRGVPGCGLLPFPVARTVGRLLER